MPYLTGMPEVTVRCEIPVLGMVPGDPAVTIELTELIQTCIDRGYLVRVISPELAQVLQDEPSVDDTADEDAGGISPHLAGMLGTAYPGGV